MGYHQPEVEERRNYILEVLRDKGPLSAAHVYVALGERFGLSEGAEYRHALGTLVRDKNVLAFNRKGHPKPFYKLSMQGLNRLGDIIRMRRRASGPLEHQVFKRFFLPRGEDPATYQPRPEEIEVVRLARSTTPTCLGEVGECRE